MQASEAVIEKIEEFEGFSADAYEDPLRPGLWTIGYGFTIGVRKGDKTTKEKAHSQVCSYVAAVVCRALNAHLKVTPTQNQFDALVCLAYNVGTTAVLDSKLFAKLNAGDPTAASEFLDWDHDYQGHEIAGLKRRRQWEHDWFTTPVAA
jgi:lysozyme